MSRIVKKWPLSPTYEIIWMGFIGMGLTAIEESCVDLQQSLYSIWTQTFPNDSFSAETQEAIKSMLSAIVLVRSVTVHLYFFSYFAMLMMAIFEQVPFLALPWMTVSLIRNFVLDMLTFLIGFFVCVRYSLAPVCYEFIIYKLCEMGVSVYLWLSVLKLYKDISSPNVRTDDLVIMRAESIRRRTKEQEVIEEPEVSQEKMLEIEVDEDDEEEEEDLEEGVQDSLERTGETKLDKTLDEEEGELDVHEATDSEEVTRCVCIQDIISHGEVLFDMQPEDKAEQVISDEQHNAGIQVDTVSKEFLDEAEEAQSGEKYSEEIQVDTVSHKFLEKAALKLNEVHS